MDSWSLKAEQVDHFDQDQAATWPSAIAAPDSVRPEQKGNQTNHLWRPPIPRAYLRTISQHFPQTANITRFVLQKILRFEQSPPSIHTHRCNKFLRLLETSTPNSHRPFWTLSKFKQNHFFFRVGRDLSLARGPMRFIPKSRSMLGVCPTNPYTVANKACVPAPPPNNRLSPFSEIPSTVQKVVAGVLVEICVYR